MNKFNLDYYLNYINNLSNYNLAYLGLFLAIGFSIGFLLKHYLKFFICVMAISGLVLYGANYFNLIAINYSMVNDYISVSHSYYPQIISYISNNISYAIAASIGFIFSFIFS